MAKNQKQLISNFFKPSAPSVAQSEKGETKSKRPRLSHLGSPVTKNASALLDDDESQPCQDVAQEVSTKFEHIPTNNFSRSLKFSTQLMELDGSNPNTEENLPQGSKGSTSRGGGGGTVSLTPLEDQVKTLKDANPGVVLVVEVCLKLHFRLCCVTVFVCVHDDI
jgi:hypothetical protein